MKNALAWILVAVLAIGFAWVMHAADELDAERAKADPSPSRPLRTVEPVPAQPPKPKPQSAHPLLFGRAIEEYQQGGVAFVYMHPDFAWQESRDAKAMKGWECEPVLRENKQRGDWESVLLVPWGEVYDIEYLFEFASRRYHEDIVPYRIDRDGKPVILDDYETVATEGGGVLFTPSGLEVR